MIVRPFITEKNIVVVQHDETLAEASSRMRDRRVGSALILVQPRGEGLGIITERDLLRAMADGVDPGDTPVSAYMTSNATTITSDWHVVDAARTMMERGFRHLLVVDEGRLVGVLSIRDMVKALLQDRQRMAAG
ncbi:CBS domain-containing protein [soil metagenome]